MKRRVSLTMGLVTAATGALFAFNVYASDLNSKFAETLVALRDQVERLSQELDDKKSEQEAELRSLNAQSADLEIQVQREQAQVDALRAAIKRRKEEAQKTKSDAQTLTPVLLQSIDTIEVSVASGLPFKKSERLAALAEIEKAVRDKSMTEVRAVGRLWQLVEDEIRLTKESGLYKQPITVGGQEVLAEVARLGMVAMYFRTDDGTVGHAIEENGEWTYRAFDSETDVAQVTYLFESFRKQIRAGAFDLPGAVWTGGTP